MRAVSMECGGWPPLLARARVAESMAAVPPRPHTPNAQPFHAVLAATAEDPPLKILSILFQNNPGRSRPPQEKKHSTVSLKSLPFQPNPLRLNYIPCIPKMTFPAPQIVRIAPFREDFTTDGTDDTDESPAVRISFQSVKSAVQLLWLRLAALRVLGHFAQNHPKCLFLNTLHDKNGSLRPNPIKPNQT